MKNHMIKLCYKWSFVLLLYVPTLSLASDDPCNRYNTHDARAVSDIKEFAPCPGGVWKKLRPFTTICNRTTGGDYCECCEHIRYKCTGPQGEIVRATKTDNCNQNTPEPH